MTNNDIYNGCKVRDELERELRAVTYELKLWNLDAAMWLPRHYAVAEEKVADAKWRLKLHKRACELCKPK